MAAEARGTLGVDLDSPVARRVLTRVQQELPVRERPYAALGDACGTSEEQAFVAVEAARTADIVRRIGASFESSRIGYAPSSLRAPLEPARVVAEPLDDADRALVRALQGDLGGTLRPFARAAEVASSYAGTALNERWASDRTRALLEAGAVRRFGAMVRHRRMGFSSNAMGVSNVPDEQVLAAGTVLAAPAEVSHCYERPRSQTWP